MLPPGELAVAASGIVVGATNVAPGVGLVSATDGGAGLPVGPVVGTTEPVHVTLFSEKEAGVGLLPVQAPLKPMFTVTFVPRAEFQLRLAALTFAPLWVQVALHPCVTDWPAAGKAKR